MSSAVALLVLHSLEAKLRNKEYDETVEESKGHPFPEYAEIEVHMLGAGFIEQRVPAWELSIHISIIDVSENTGPRGKESIVESWHPV